MLHQNLRQIKFMDFLFCGAVPKKRKQKSRSPRGFLPRPLLRAGESITPPPFPQKNSGGVLVAFTALLLCRSSVLRTEARSARWTLGILLEIGSSKVYDYSTSSNLFGIRNMERFCGSQNRALIFAKTLSAYGGSREIP